MFYRCCQIESCMSNLLHVHPKYFITQLEKSPNHDHLGKNMEPSVMNIAHLVQLVTLGKLFAICTNNTAYLFQMLFFEKTTIQCKLLFKIALSLFFFQHNPTTSLFAAEVLLGHPLLIQ